MKRSILILLFLLFSAKVFAVENVSLINLISDPAKYNGKEVSVAGYLVLDFEGTAIYLSKGDYDNGIYKNALWVTISLPDSKNFDHKYVNIQGVFDSKMRGHLGLWPGSLKDIKRVWLTIPAK